MSQSPSRRQRPNNNNSSNNSKRMRGGDMLEVVCRLKDTKDPNPCAVAEDTQNVCLIPPTSYARGGNVLRRVYRFAEVFDAGDSQAIVFKRCCIDLLEELVHGRNALLFAYGVTGSGKTYTMTGDTNNMGILPRAADVLFNSVPELANRCVFYPDGRNGFGVRSEYEAFEEQRKLPRSRFELNKRMRESKHTKFFPKDVVAGVFVSYVEIYNDVCYDLLDESLSPSNRANMSKNLRSTVNGQVFVDQLTEVEVQSGDEVIMHYMEAEERRKKAATMLNASSSRSHTIFSIRLVTCPKAFFENGCVDEPKVTISQLSIVDLAGSERAKRTNNVGDRLVEAAKINQSLFALRKCFEQMRENQRSGYQAPVSYRDYKLTHLFKNFFEGGGKVRMIVCLNPSSAEYEENLFVMSFAECAQTVEVKTDEGPTLTMGELTGGQRYGRREVKTWLAEVSSLADVGGADLQLRLATRAPPRFKLVGPDDVEAINALRDYVQERKVQYMNHLAAANSNANIFEQNMLQMLCDADLSRHRMVEMEQEMEELSNTNESLFAQKKQTERELNAIKKRMMDYEGKENKARRVDDEERARQRKKDAAWNQQQQTMLKVAELVENPISTSRVAAIRRNFQ